MNFKKLAIVAAVLASSSAFAVTDYDPVGNAVGDDVNALAQAELAAVGTLAGDGNVAFINQEGAGNIAYIDQITALNFASVVQVNDAAIGIVYQSGGDANRAAIYQHQ